MPFIVKSVSIVVPVYNEVQSLAPLLEKLLAAREDLVKSLAIKHFEIIFIDDGSTDGTTDELRRLSAQEPLLKALIFQRNFGKSAALSAGFSEARGDVVVTLDGDLQDDPAEIVRLVEKLGEGYDLVSGWKRSRKDPLEKRLASKLFNRIVSLASGIRIHDFNCGIKAYRSWCVRDFVIHGNMHRFLPVILAQRGAKVAELPVAHHKRSHGRSKFGASRYYQGMLDLFSVLFLTRFYTRPLYFFGSLALPMIFLGGAIGAYFLVEHLAYVLGFSWGQQLNSRPLLSICISLFGFGLQVLLTGLLGEMLLRQSNTGKSYWVKKTFDGNGNGKDKRSAEGRDGEPERREPGP